jgi:TolB-like protein/DNA-binding winged helix-turn-helix (wHTH) protein/Flp pilus assembly protein TadD
MSAPTRGPLWIGEWLVDPQTDTITRGGRTQKLEPRMMRLLMLLAEAPGTVVGADRMLREIWSGVVVSSSSVYQAISQLRRLLEDTEPEPTHIATVPRKGYRLIATVRPVETGSAAVPAAARQPEESPVVLPPAPASGASRTRRLGVAVVIVVLVVAAAAWILGRVYFARRPAAPVADTTPVIVVLPFSDMTPDRQDQFFCDGLTEELSNWLAQIPTLRVVARTSAFAFRGHQDAREIGRQLNTTHVVEGSMRRYGDHMRITVQLIDARTGYHLWSSEYDRQPEDTITLQEDVARAVAESLQIRLTEDTALKFAERRSESAQAYNLYLLALHYQGERTHEANKQAVELYQQVITADPKFTLAYTGLSIATLNQHYLNGRSMAQTTAAAEPLLQTAERLDPQLSELYTARGALREDQGRIDEAQHDLRRAVVLNPNDSRAHAELGRLLLIMARPREALEALTRALTLDPLDFTQHARACFALQDMGRFTDAATACSRARALQGDANFGSVVSSWLEWSQGHLPEALEWATDAQKDAPADVTLYQQRAELLLTMGLSRPARQVLEQARVATRNDDRVNLALSGLTYYDGGVDALRSHLATSHLENLRGARDLLDLAHYYLLAEEPDAAAHACGLAKQAHDYDASALSEPWYARWGQSEGLIVALCELQTGQRDAANAHLQGTLTTVDQAIAAGEQRFGLYLLRAQVLALRGENDAAMQALTRAADLGWRQSWWAEHEPWFAGLRSRPDFRALMARIDANVRQLRARTQLAN